MDKSTRFRELVEPVETHKTRGGRAMEGVVTAVVGLLMMIFGAIGVFALAGMRLVGCGCFAIAVLGLLLLIAGVFNTFVAPLRRARKVRCPQCGHERSVLRKTAQTLCPECGRIMLLEPAGTSSDLTPSTCDYCGMSVARDPGLSAWDCPSCGTAHGLVDPSTTSPATECPSCGERIPAGARYCKSCSQVLPDRYEGPVVDSPGVEARLGMTAEGHWAWAAAVMRNDDARLGANPPSDNLATTLELLRHLGPVFESLEEAALDSAQRDRVIWSLQFAQGLYGRLLERAAWELGLGPKVHKVPSVAPLDKYDYIAQRRRVIDLLPGSDTGLPDWRRGLVKVSDKGSAGPKRYSIKDWSPLYEEMLRITGKQASAIG